MSAPVRILVLWFPDWPVTALTLAASESAVDAVSAGGPVAVFERNLVVACSAAARASGVRRGQRRRDAQAASPGLVVVAADPDRDARTFVPVVARVEELAPGVQILRPGLCALRARGPARYYGGEEEAARMLLRALADDGLPDVRAGIADGPFTAQLAARATAPDAAVRVVPPGGAPDFLSPLSVGVLGDTADASLPELLARLGVHTLGAFAGMPVDRVRERFGPQGVRVHALASGRDSRPIEPTPPPPELHREVEFEPPLELAEQIAFGMRIAADEFIGTLAERRLVCTELRVELTGDRGERSDRVWLHPGAFDAAAVVDRVRWQLAALRPPGDATAATEGGAFAGGVARVRIAPEAVDAAAHHAIGLFGAGPEERVHHALSRVQAMLGHEGVLTPAVGGGRWLTERQVLVPWGDRAVLGAERGRPWPGSLPDPLPATVFPVPRAVEVTDGGGATVVVGEREVLSAPPAQLGVAGRRRGIRSWAGPWPIRERGWDAARRRRAHRFQVVDADGVAWLLVEEGGVWVAEGRYD